MIFYIKYKKTINEYIFKLWLNHYKKTNLKFGIFVKNEDLIYFKNKYHQLGDLIITECPINVLELTEKDFLFSYLKNNDNMVLCYDIDSNFIKESICIGKVFYVPVKNKELYTTFEIPDFILFEHDDHTNYTIDGIKINGGKNISKKLVCLNLNVSKVANENEFYDNRVLIMDTGNYRAIIGSITYVHCFMNIMVNKQKKYGIIWYSKCGCSTITSIFCKINNIDMGKEDIISVVFFKPVYKYNVYLQNIDFISFTRNPYNRFISSFIDKNVDHVDNIFLNIDGYLSYINTYKIDNMNNLCNFLLKDGYITEHYTKMCHYDYIQKIKTKVCKIENNLNEQLYNFLSKYHDNLDATFIKTCHANINSHMKKNALKETKETKECNQNMNMYNFILFDRADWLNYLSTNNLDYNKILKNTKLKELIYKVYQKDFEKFGYEK